MIWQGDNRTRLSRVFFSFLYLLLYDFTGWHDLLHKLTSLRKPLLLHKRLLAVLERPCFCYVLSFISQANIPSHAIIASQAPAGTARTTLCFYLPSFISQASITSQAHGEGQQVTQIGVTCWSASTTTRIVILLLSHALFRPSSASPSEAPELAVAP